MHNNNKSIAKNTCLLYVRMIISIIISLYTSRVILNALGVEDYGIYNVVGSTVTIVGFLSSTMSASTSRFLSIAIGNKDAKGLISIFRTALTLHLILAGIILFLGETVGLWFVNKVLNIPLSQLYAANWVYQLSLLATCIAIIQIPYDAVLVAYENIKIFAYFQILNSFLKLGIASVILLIAGNRLIVYAILVFIVALLMRTLYRLYAERHYPECKFVLRFDKQYLAQLASFSGWDVLGHLGFTARSQGINILLNVFFGATLNAAAGIATTVQGIISSFSSNIIVAARPRIIKTYAAKEYATYQNMISNIGVLSFSMVVLVTVPLILNLQEILRLWLGTVPEWCYQFTLCCLIGGVVTSVSSVYLIGIHAEGNVKYSSLGRNITYILSLFVLYIIFKSGMSPVWAYIVVIITQIITFVNDGVLLRRSLPWKLQLSIFAKCVLMLLLGVGYAHVVSYIVVDSVVFTILLNSFAFALLFGISTFFCVANRVQRQMVIKKLHLSA